MDGVNFKKTLETIKTFNISCKSNRKFDPTILDGRKTVGLEVQKSNWALTLDTPPYSLPSDWWDYFYIWWIKNI